MAPPIHPTQKMNLFRAEKVEVQASKVILTYLYPPVNQGTKPHFSYYLTNNSAMRTAYIYKE